MRKLIVSTFVTLDGVVQAPGGPGEDDSGGFAHGGWSVNYWDEQMGQACRPVRLWVVPLVIGSGKRLFSDGTIPSGLKLVDNKVSTTGVVMGTYEPAGEIVTGSFALD